MGRPRKVKPQWEPLTRRKHGSGSIQRLADGTLRARLPARVDPKRTSREFPPNGLAEATAWLDRALRPETAPAHSGATTLGDWTGHWYQTFVEPVRTPNTAKAYLYALRQLEPLYAAPLAELKPSQLQAEVGRLTGRVGGANVQNVVGVWRRCLEAAIDDELIAKNPARRLVVPKAPPRPVRRHVTAAEVAALWPAIEGHRFEAAFALMLGCGLRIGEILGLAWSNVDLPNRRIWVQDQFTNGHWRPLPKGSNPHWVPLPARVAAALIRHRDRQPPGTVLVMQGPGRRAKRDRTQPWPWSAATVGEDLAAIVTRLGLDPLSPHAGRHGLATALLDGGVPPAVVAERLGHADPSITMRAYAGVSGQGRARADALVEAYLDGSAPGPVSGAESRD